MAAKKKSTTKKSSGTKKKSSAQTSTAAEKRLQRQINNHRDNEARWLQKVLFAFGKARDAREKLTEATGEELNPLITLDDGNQIPLDTLEEIIQKRVDDLNAALGRGVYARRR